MVHSFHHGGRCILLVVAMVEEKFCQRRKQRRSGSVTGAICDPEQNSAVFHSQPAIDIAAHLDDRAITRCNLPMPAVSVGLTIAVLDVQLPDRAQDYDAIPPIHHSAAPTVAAWSAGEAGSQFWPAIPPD